MFFLWARFFLLRRGGRARRNCRRVGPRDGNLQVEVRRVLGDVCGGEAGRSDRVVRDRRGNGYRYRLVECNRVENLVVGRQLSSAM